MNHITIFKENFSINRWIKVDNRENLVKVGDEVRFIPSYENDIYYYTTVTKITDSHGVKPLILIWGHWYKEGMSANKDKREKFAKINIPTLEVYK